MHSLHRKPRKGGRRFLISVTVMWSPGPIRFVVGEGDRVATVIATALRSYAREGRFPALGAHSDDFLLFPPASDALSLDDTISAKGSRNFMLRKKQQPLFPAPTPDRANKSDNATSPVLPRKLRGRSFTSWITKSLGFP